MALQNVERYYHSKDNVCLYPGLLVYGAVLFWQNSQTLREAMIATNIDMLRIKAPYAYLFVSRSIDAGVIAHLKEPSEEFHEMQEEMEILQLKRGVWLSSPEHEEPVTTLVVNIGLGKILPFAHDIYDDFNALLCLPEPRTLSSIDDAISKAESHTKAVAALLAEGGFVLLAIDHINLYILTSDKSYKSLFQAAPNE